MSLGRCVASLLAALCLQVAAVGCGSDDLVFPGMVLPTAVPTTTETPGCVTSGGACTVSGDCCSGDCFTPDGVNFECA
jgi:hypothetical protein